MRSKTMIVALSLIMSLMLPFLATADEPDAFELTVSGVAYYELVTEYEWQVDASVESGDLTITAVNLTAGGQILLDYGLAVTRAMKDTGFFYGIRGEVTVVNNTGAPLEDKQVLLKLEARQGDEEWDATEYEIILTVDLDESDTFPYDFVIDINDFTAYDQLNFQVVAEIVSDEETFAGKQDNLLLPEAFTSVNINLAAVVDAEFVWLQSGVPVALPAGVTLLTAPASKSWILDTANLTEGETTLTLLALLSTETFTGTPGTHSYDLRLDVSVTPSEGDVAQADTLLLPVNITVPSAGNHSVHFYVASGNGALTAWFGGSELVNGASLPAGSNVGFLATPEAGYRVKEWRINGVVQPGNGTTLPVPNLAANIVVVVEFAPVAVADSDEKLEGNPAAPALATMILKQHNIPHRLATNSLRKNGKPIYINLIAEVAKQNRGNSFMGVERTNQAAFYTAVYDYLKQLGAQLP